MPSTVLSGFLSSNVSVVSEVEAIYGEYIMREYIMSFLSAKDWALTGPFHFVPHMYVLAEQSTQFVETWQQARTLICL